MSGLRSRKDFIERLAIYFLGVAMGLMILGFFWSNRQRAVQRQQAQQRAAQQAPETPAGEGPGGTP
jgi:hypothetical protein